MQIVVLNWERVHEINGSKISSSAGCSVHFSEEGAERAIKLAESKAELAKPKLRCGPGTSILYSKPERFIVYYYKTISQERLCKMADMSSEDLTACVLQDTVGIRLTRFREYDFA